MVEWLSRYLADGFINKRGRKDVFFNFLEGDLVYREEKLELRLIKNQSGAK